MIRLSGRAVSIHTAGEAAADQLSGIVQHSAPSGGICRCMNQARRRSYQISASEVCDAIIASAMPQAVKPSLLPGPAVGSMAAQMVDPVLQLVIISLRETFCPVVYNLVVNLETRTDDRFCGQRQTDRALFA